MKSWLLCFTCVLLILTTHAQKKEEYYDFNFHPSKTGGRYYVITEKEGTLWHRQAYFVPELTMAMNGWYKDEECKTPKDTMTWYHTSRYIKSKGRYIDGKKEGIWLEFNEEGLLRDSSNYVDGHLKGIGLGWHSNGMISDSTNFDGAGNGVRIKWDDEGNIMSAGYIEQDTLMKGRWKYYQNGKLLAQEDYANGKKINCECYDETGVKLDTAICNKEKEASFPGGLNGWRRFLERTLNPQVPADKGAKDGWYTILLRFRVDKEGNIQDLKATTAYGYGMEEEALRVLRLSPKWEPALQFGRKVNAYRLQPITFVISGR